MKTEYRCQECGKKVYPLKSAQGDSSKYLRTCEHEKAGIVADMKASCAGKGALKQ